MALTNFYMPRWDRVIDANGSPRNGAKLKFYEAGSSTPLNVYSDVDGVSSLGSTVTSDAFGLFPQIFMLPQAYRVDLCNSADTVIWTTDDFFPPQPASAANQDFTAICGVAFAAGEGAYISDGSGALNAGQAYKWDADLEYASARPECGIAIGAYSIGEEGTFRAGGVMTGLSGLSPGSRYYISGTAGAMSTTAGAHERFIGQAKSTTEMIVETNPPVVDPIDARVKHTADGRLTLTTALPVTISDVTAAGTLYYTPYIGNQIGLYDGARWVTYTFSELSIAAPAAANQMYDAFLDYNDGAPALVLLAWTNDTTRATALVRQDGILVKTGDTQQRYLGSVRTRTASQFNDAYAFRHVWNMYNRVSRPCRVTDPANSWTAGADGVVRQANANAANQIDIVVGVSEDEINVRVLHQGSNSAGGIFFWAGIGEDSTTAKATGSLATELNPAANDRVPLPAALDTIPAVGRHVYVWLEEAATAASTSFFGDNGGLLVQTGITAAWRA